MEKIVAYTISPGWMGKFSMFGKMANNKIFRSKYEQLIIDDADKVRELASKTIN